MEEQPTAVAATAASASPDVDVKVVSAPPTTRAPNKAPNNAWINKLGIIMGAEVRSLKSA
jgi:hypothetical protein